MKKFKQFIDSDRHILAVWLCSVSLFLAGLGICLAHPGFSLMGALGITMFVAGFSCYLRLGRRLHRQNPDTPVWRAR